MEDSINLFLRDHRMLVIVVGGAIIIGPFLVPFLRDYFSSESKLERKNNRENERITRKENERIAKEKREDEQRERELRIKETKEAELIQYEKLRKDIEAMPEYERWRQAVFKEFGRRCRICGSTENLEIDHRYKSFYAIIKQYSITNVTQAYECAELWDVNNGGVLCKSCHDGTASSAYRQLKNRL